MEVARLSNFAKEVSCMDGDATVAGDNPTKAVLLKRPSTARAFSGCKGMEF
jgi:hypothetical protein